MTSADEYKRVALELLEHFSEITKEHMAMSEVLRSRPALTAECRGYLPQAKQAVDSVFAPCGPQLSLEPTFAWRVVSDKVRDRAFSFALGAALYVRSARAKLAPVVQIRLQFRR